MQNAEQLIRSYGEEAVALADLLHEACEHSARISNPDIGVVHHIRSDGHGLNFVVAVFVRDAEGQLIKLDSGRYKTTLRRVIITSL